MNQTESFMYGGFNSSPCLNKIDLEASGHCCPLPLLAIAYGILQRVLKNINIVHCHCRYVGSNLLKFASNFSGVMVLSLKLVQLGSDKCREG